MALPAVMLAAYLVALVYGTLYPWTGWRWVGGSAFGFAFAPWPRWWTGFDVAMNIASYLPLGVLTVLALRPRRGPRVTVVTAVLLGCGLSFLLEALQSHLPQRVPSQLDWLANTAGAALGACLAVLSRGRAWTPLTEWVRRQASGAGPARADSIGITLIVSWHRHHRTRAVIHQDKIGNPNRH